MAIRAHVGNDNFVLTPEGNHVATCFRMIHIGRVQEEFNGNKRIVNRIRIGFELNETLRVFNEEDGEQPFVIEKEYTLSMHEQANLRKDLESWRGKGFAEDEADGFDVTVLLGKPCLVNVVHRTSKSSGRQYAAISVITTLPRSIQPPKQVNPTFVFDYEENFDQFDQLPDWLKKRVENSEEYFLKEQEKSVSAQNGPPKAPASAVVVNEDDDTPF